MTEHSELELEVGEVIKVGYEWYECIAPSIQDWCLKCSMPKEYCSYFRCTPKTRKDKTYTHFELAKNKSIREKGYYIFEDMVKNKM